MKKILIFICIFSFTLLFVSNTKIKAEDIAFDDTLVEAGGGAYQVMDRTNYETIDYGVKYTRDIAVSKSLNQIGGKKEFDPQVVNLLEVPTSSVMKVVNWTYSTSNRWSLQTLTNLAEDFENNNPGWSVIAGINGDFFDISATKALPRQTTGAAVNNGEVVRAVSSGRQVGFTNNGTTNSLIGGKNLQFTDYHTLSVYDENEEIIKEFKVDKFNQQPTGEEISVYFSAVHGSHHRASGRDPLRRELGAELLDISGSMRHRQYAARAYHISFRKTSAAMGRRQEIYRQTFYPLH